MTFTSPVHASRSQTAADELPSGRIGMMFSDVEGSTLLLQKLSRLYGPLITRHSQIMRSAITANKGMVARTAGDSFFATFSNPVDAVPCAIQAQSALAAENWPDGSNVKVRIGVHCGEASLFDGEYVGLDIHRAARISDAGNGGQTLLSREMIDALNKADMLPHLEIRELGLHRLKDLHYRESLFELLVPGLAPNAAPLRSLEQRPSNLPTAPAKLIGRDDDIEALKAVIAPGRLITVVGAGGIGKTSLAVAVGQETANSFAGGVFLVKLSSVSEPDLVASTIAQTLGVRDFPGRSVVDDIVSNIGLTHALLILDTFEHVIDAASVISELLTKCPNLAVLATSREALNIHQEHLYEVTPLAWPLNTTADLRELRRVESVRLFVERVRTFDPGFDVDIGNASAIGDICRQLEGLPLAIELAAARMRLMPPKTLAQRLGDRLGLLTGGKRDHDRRHRTLRDTIEWSDNLLSAAERNVFQRVSVFAGGFRLEDAEAVIALEDENVIDHMFALASKSLLRRTDLNGTPRLTMFDAVRDYAHSGLADQAEGAALYERHADYFISVSEAAAPHLVSQDQRVHVTRLLDEADNIRAALAWSFQHEDAGRVSRLLGALHWLWIAQAQFTEAQKWVDQGIKVAEKLGTGFEKANILNVAGWVRLLSGNYEGAAPLCAAAHSAYETLADNRGIAYTGLTLGVARAVAMDPQGPTLILKSLDMFEKLDDPIGVALALIALGEGARAEGDDVAAEDCDLRALDILTAQGNTYWPCQIRQNLAHIRLHDGDWATAAAFLVDALKMGREFGYAMIDVLCVAAWGGVELKRGQPRRAAEFFGAAATMIGRLGVSLEPVDRTEYEKNMADARSTLGDGEFTLAFNEGAAWNREETLSLLKL